MNDLPVLRRKADDDIEKLKQRISELEGKLKLIQTKESVEHIEYACRQYSICVEVVDQGMFDMIPLAQLLEYANKIRNGKEQSDD